MQRVIAYEKVGMGFVEQKLYRLGCANFDGNAPMNGALITRDSAQLRLHSTERGGTRSRLSFLRQYDGGGLEDRKALRRLQGEDIRTRGRPAGLPDVPTRRCGAGAMRPVPLAPSQSAQSSSQLECTRVCVPNEWCWSFVCASAQVCCAYRSALLPSWLPFVHFRARQGETAPRY